MARMMPAPEWLRHQFSGESWWHKVEHSGWLMGPHIVSRVGPQPRFVTPEALDALVQLQHAERLWLHDCGLTDEQLKHIAQIQGVKSLDINGNPITDAGLEHLTALASLEHLAVNETLVTAEGVERFRRKMPHCTIYAHDPPQSVVMEREKRGIACRLGNP
jgi:hypothetical protein